MTDREERGQAGRPEIIPAIDLLDGRVVRLWQGDYARPTVYADDPARVADGWRRAGARRLHVVDLDGARSGRPRHLGALRAIARAFDGPVQYGGGLRSFDDIRAALEAGAERVVLGTRAVREPDWLRRAADTFGAAVSASLDLAGRRALVEGWRRGGSPAVSTLRAWAAAGLAALVVTDARRDGTMGGVGRACLRLAAASGIPFQLAGGVGDERDLLELAPWVARGLTGVIVGRALYEGRVSLDGRRLPTC